jgi:polyhydroxyalkanoate synthase
VHLVGWSLGGVFALLAAAGDTDLPVASITVVGSPFDVREVPLVAPLRPLLNFTDGRGAITRLYQAAGGAPQPLVRWAFQLSSFQRLVTKPLAIARHLDDADYLAQIEAVDRFTDNMIAYPGRTFGQLYHRLLKGNALVDGTFEVGDRTLSVADVAAPVLVFAGAADGIAPVASVKASVPLLTGSREVRFEIVPGGHLGMLTGRKARGSTWLVLDEWIDQWSEPDLPAGRTPRRTPARKTATTKAETRKSTTKKTTAKKPTARTSTAGKSTRQKSTSRKSTATKKVAKKAGSTEAAGGKPSAEEIGTNPSRRYGSAGSRALGGR